MSEILSKAEFIEADVTYETKELQWQHMGDQIELATSIQLPKEESQEGIQGHSQDYTKRGSEFSRSGLAQYRQIHLQNTWPLKMMCTIPYMIIHIIM